MRAAIFRQAHEPVTIESVDIDAPSEREVFVAHGRHGGVP